MKKRGEKAAAAVFSLFLRVNPCRDAAPQCAARPPPVPGTGERVAGEGARQADPAIRASSSRADAPHRWDFLESARNQVQGGGGATSRSSVSSGTHAASALSGRLGLERAESPRNRANRR